MRNALFATLVAGVFVGIVTIWSTVASGGCASERSACESAFDRCARGDCTAWDRLTEYGRSDRCDAVIDERLR